MHFLERYKLFLFDLDGLLVDTEILHWRAYKSVVESWGGTFDWDYPSYLVVAGKSAFSIREKLESEQPHLFIERSWEDLYARKKSTFLRLLSESEITLMPGVEGAMEYIAQRGFPMVVVTHSPIQVVDAVKKLPALSPISRWISREEYSNPKPAPDGYLVACKEFNVSPEDAIGFEDAVRGVDSLLAAGCRPILINKNNDEARQTCIARGIPVFSSFEEVVSETASI